MAQDCGSIRIGRITAVPGMHPQPCNSRCHLPALSNSCVRWITRQAAASR